MSVLALQLLGLALLQTTIMPALALAAIDLCVVWLVVFAVRNKLSTSIAVAACLALGMETYGVAPLGSYFGAYWLIILSVHALRHLVVWKLNTPWLVAFATAAGVVILTETLMIDLTYVDLDSYLLQSMWRIAITSVAGIILLKISKLIRKRRRSIGGSSPDFVTGGMAARDFHRR